MIVFLVFLVFPILMALWVSLLDWNGQTNPLTEFDFVGLDNYRRLLTEDSLLREDFAISVRNTLYYVLVFVPGATALAFFLAAGRQQPGAEGARLLPHRVLLPVDHQLGGDQHHVPVPVPEHRRDQHDPRLVRHRRARRGSPTPAGVIHIVLDNLGIVDPQNPPGWLADTDVFGLSLWQWIAGPSVAMCALLFLAIWTTSGTFMLFFLAGLQNIAQEVDEASAVDGATKWQRFRYITMPLMRPSIALVVTLAIIGSWQVFDQVFIITQGDPEKTTQTPAYLSYTKSFGDGQFGQGAAIAFVLFLIIIVLAGLQRVIGRERKPK